MMAPCLIALRIQSVCGLLLFLQQPNAERSDRHLAGYGVRPPDGTNVHMRSGLLSRRLEGLSVWHQYRSLSSTHSHHCQLCYILMGYLLENICSSHVYTRSSRLDTTEYITNGIVFKK